MCTGYNEHARSQIDQIFLKIFVLCGKASQYDPLENVLKPVFILQ